MFLMGFSTVFGLISECPSLGSANKEKMTALLEERRQKFEEKSAAAGQAPAMKWPSGRTNAIWIINENMFYEIFLKLDLMIFILRVCIICMQVYMNLYKIYIVYSQVYIQFFIHIYYTHIYT